MKKVDIRNYTSSVAANKSVLDIENILISLGARNIMKEYDGFGKMNAISFSIPHLDGVIPFKLPVKRDAIKKVILSKYRRVTSSQAEQAEQQADRTAWKNVKDWVHIQATMIKLEQVEFMEVFMPYLYNMNKGRTAFEVKKDSNFQKLLS